MKNRIILSIVLSAFGLTGVANAQVAGSGTLGVSATLVGSINMIFTTDASGFAVTGTGTSTASMPFGNVQMYGGVVPTNVTRTLNGTTSFTLTTPFDITVSLANSTSADFTLTAALNAADAVNTWSIASVVITSVVASITTTGAYATQTPYSFALTIPASEAAGSISNTINFTATAN